MKTNDINYKIIFFSFLFIFLVHFNSYGLENKIIYKVNKEIITSLDLTNEINYLSALNPNIKKLPKKEIIKLSQRSIINEKIKEIEILRNFKNPKLPTNFLEELLKNVYLKIGIENLEDFKIFLISNKIDYQDVLKKIEIEALWNELIVSKFSKKIKIDEIKLREKVNKNINTISKSYLLSEIFFGVNKNEKIKDKYKEITDSIREEGFGNAALKHSISETSKIGGKLNWIDENSLNNEIKKIISSKKINEFTDPITLPGGFLILQINDIKITKTKKDVEKELKKLIKASKNYQLNQYSKIYFNRVKEDIEINEI